MGIWSKVHPALPLRTELSISNHLCQIFEKYANCRNKRAKAAVVKNIKDSANTVYNLTTCKCGLPDTNCTSKQCVLPNSHTHVRCLCEKNKVIIGFNFSVFASQGAHK